jgi:hypothetical protein
MFFFFSVPEIWKTGLTCLIGLATLIVIMTRPVPPLPLRALLNNILSDFRL